MYMYIWYRYCYCCDGLLFLLVLVLYLMTRGTLGTTSLRTCIYYTVLHMYSVYVYPHFPIVTAPLAPPVLTKLPLAPTDW